jgi:hypothetical protein
MSGPGPKEGEGEENTDLPPCPQCQKEGLRSDVYHIWTNIMPLKGVEYRTYRCSQGHDWTVKDKWEGGGGGKENK